MKKVICVIMLTCALSYVSSNPMADPSPVQPDTDELIETADPIILVHGFAGWGRNDIPGFYYWGGLRDLEAILRGEGYNVHTASIGPFSSNWDRACELYAAISGGTVDYGEAHSTEHGHARYGPVYPGLYPTWSEADRIHIIGHSMGGQTARLLAHLLRHGAEAERAVSKESCSRLFQGGGQRIGSITTISTPHNGTTIVNDVDVIDTIMRAAIAALAAVLENETFGDIDLKLGHWGIRRAADEPIGEYFERLTEHDLWSKSQRDFSLWDASVEGSSELNRYVSAERDVYYFSWANEATTTGPVGEYIFPELSMLAVFIPSSVYIASFSDNDVIKLAHAWRYNDGVVNTTSMKGPILQSQDIIIDYNLRARPGVWNYMGELVSADHADVLGMPSWQMNGANEFVSILEFYTYLCDLAYSLP